MNPDKQDIILCFLGDCYLGMTPESICLSSEISPILSQADLVIADLEGPLTSIERPAFDKCSIRSSPSAAAKLREWGIDVVTVANNHIFDFGWKGFDETRSHLNDNGILYVGAGADLHEAMTPKLLTLKGTRIGLLGFSWGFIQSTCATEHSFGCAPLDKGLMITAVQELASNVDVLILLAHWGYCGYTIPMPEQRILARCLLEAGASAIVGCHSHVVQGIEVVSQKVIAYSLGDFVFSSFVDENRAYVSSSEQERGMILELRVQADGAITHAAYNTTNIDGTICLDSSWERTAERAAFSRALNAPNYAKLWRRYNRKRFMDRAIYWSKPANWPHFQKGTLTGALIMLKDMCSRGHPS